MEYDRAQLKRRVRQAMKGQRPRPMLITLLFAIIVNIGTQTVNGILGTVSGSSAMTEMYAELVVQRQREPLAAVQYIVMHFGPQRLALALLVGFVLAALVTILWENFMGTGYSSFCLGMVRGAQPQTAVLFSHFPRWGGVLSAKFLEGVFRTLWELLLGAGASVLLFVIMLLFASVPVLAIPLVLCVYIALLLGITWVTLRYELVDFLSADQGLTGMDAIRESKRLMRENGNTGRLFTLKLSFIGWHLLELGVLLVFAFFGVLMFGPQLAAATGTPDAFAALVMSMLGFVGLFAFAGIAIGIFNLWLTPYITGARALFYHWVRGGDFARPAAGTDGGRDWGQPGGYSRASGPSSGTGIGPGPWDGGDAPSPPRSPRPPRDDPWD